MFKIDKYLNGGDEGEWYEVDGGPASIRIRKLKPKEFDAIRRKSQVRSFGNRGAKEILDDKMMRLCLHEMVVGWKDLEYQSKEFICNEENRTLLDENWMAFRQLWQNVLMEDLQTETVALEEGQKNL